MSTPASSFLRDSILIAGFDLRESLRTRRALVLVLLYLLIASAASGIYVQVVRGLQRGAEMIAPGEEAAVAMMQDTGWRAMLLFFAGGDNTLAAHLATYPPMVLIFAWTSLAFLPWFIALTSYDQIAGELHLRTIRYAALRTTRAAFVAGKLLGQAALVAGVAGLGMLPVFLIGAIYLPGFSPVATLTALLSTWPITVVCALGFLGIVSLASQLTRTPGTARAAAVGLLFAIWICSLPFGYFVYLGFISPWHWESGLFQPGLVDRLTAVFACLALCVGYTSLGYLRFRGRDL